MAIPVKGTWSAEQVNAFLGDCSFPIRLGSIGADGFPRVVSLWYQFDQGRLYSVTHKNSYLASLLRNNNKVGFEISPNEPPYMGVRGHGAATLEPLGEQSTLTDLLNHYLGGTESKLAAWLLSRSDEELLITVNPDYIFSWDYRERMEAVS
jgi:nitroimidazol reductase NimA-like FMN-containing flavoprotein (pyridoxamine 5'-phosphate oxidase superfamily)